MNDNELIGALKSRLTKDGQVSVQDCDLLIWTATSLNGGSPIQFKSTCAILLYCEPDAGPHKINAIKGLRVMTEAITGEAWGLKQSKDAVDKATDERVTIMEYVPSDLAKAEVTKYNKLGTGYVAVIQ